MKTEFSKFEIAAIKRTAQNCAGMIAKFEKLSEKIATLQAEKESVERQIAQWDSPIVEMTGSHVMDLVRKERYQAGTDKTGAPIYGTKWVLKYPETIIPPSTPQNVETDNDIDNEPQTEQPDNVPTEEETSLSSQDEDDEPIRID